MLEIFVLAACGLAIGGAILLATWAMWILFDVLFGGGPPEGGDYA